MDWYRKTASTILAGQEVNYLKGLTDKQAQERLKVHGPNTLASKKKQSLFSIFLKQFKSPLIYILIIAAILVVAIGQKTDPIVIIFILVFNAVVGTIQERKARDSLAKLRELTRHEALVRRDGKEELIPSERVVPGDILILHEGDRVAADARIIKQESLTVDEAILTGEAYPVSKVQDVINKKNLVAGDQKNMLFAGTGISSGWAEAVVIATGLHSELGKISKDLQETSNVALPLERKITKLSNQIALVVGFIALSVLLLGLIKGIGTKEIFGAVVGLSVSIIPEGLPVVVTIVLAKGVWRMAKAKAIVRQMAAVEAMGSADILLVDKTGTITTGNMFIKQVFFNSEQFQVSGQGYIPQGEIMGKKGSSLKNLKTLLTITYLAIKADIVEENGKWLPIGDPTEAAIVVLCRKVGFSKTQLQKDYKTVEAKPFDSKKRYLEATFAKGRQTWDVFVGAPDFLSKSLKINHNLTKEYQELTNLGLRVVGVAVYGPQEKQLFGYALFAIDEEIRPNVNKSIAEAKEAGFRVAMMTGDFPATAKSIATEVGIFTKGDKVLTGEEVEKMSENELAEQINQVSVFARITPLHKLKIVNAFKKIGHVVAMTGDGVNDGPALQAANLGIGLGSGTQVAKDASDIILVDNNFSTITAAIAEGRGIYLTLKKVILYLFSTSFGEVLVIAMAIFANLPLPLVAVQIIWLNFVTDGFLDISIAQDPPENNLLEHKFESKNLIDRLMMERIFLMGFAMLVSTLPIFYFYLENFSLTYARSAALLTLSMTQWFNALNVRSKTQSIFKTPLTNNWLLVGAFAVVITLQFFAIHSPLGNMLLHTESLKLSDWAIAVFACSPIIIFEEIRKYYARKQTHTALIAA